MDRVAVAQATLKVIEDGGYQAPDGRSVELRAAIDAARAGTRFYRAESMPIMEVSMRRQTQITVTEETTCEAIVRLAAEERGHLAALNFASARNPGGGFLGGAQAQEEAITRSSALYPCLCTQEATYYKPNRANRSLLYLDVAIFSPGVPFFRDDAGTLLPQPPLASVITAPAPNAGAVQKNQPHDVAKIEPTLRRRAEFVLAIAAQEKVERLILGAWGCGVFRNDPAMVARAFGDLLLRGGRYADAFSEVVFAIYDRSAARGTLRAFQSEFRA